MSDRPKCGWCKDTGEDLDADSYWTPTPCPKPGCVAARDLVKEQNKKRSVKVVNPKNTVAGPAQSGTLRPYEPASSSSVTIDVSGAPVEAASETEARRLFDVWPDCTGVRVVVSVLRGTAARVVSVHVGFEDGVTHESIPLPVREGQPTSEVVREIVDELIVNAEDEDEDTESESNSE